MSADGSVPTVKCSCLYSGIDGFRYDVFDCPAHHQDDEGPPIRITHLTAGNIEALRAITEAARHLTFIHLPEDDDSAPPFLAGTA